MVQNLKGYAIDFFCCVEILMSKPGSHAMQAKIEQRYNGYNFVKSQNIWVD